MLAQTFQHIRGIGRKKELALWKSGIKSWDDFESVRCVQRVLFGTGEGDPVAEALASSRLALREGLVGFFADRLPRREHYRIACSFPSKTLFLDIETTGLSFYYDQVTIIGWASGPKYHAYVVGADKHEILAFKQALSEAKVVVTFNGTLFDVPFLRVHYPGLLIPPVHVDLRFLARRVGLSGGQKQIERLLRLRRAITLDAMRGDAAPLLWHRYKRGDIGALKLLVAYNRADIEGMKVIFDAVVKRLLRSSKIPMATRQIRFFSRARIGQVGDAESEVSLVPFRGRTGPALRFDDLGLDGVSNSLRIVGIDPTGSSSRASGWCLVEGNRVVSTRRLNTDDEILKATLDAAPDLVSIDSPLSLPRGRKGPSDEDPGRGEFGITRECERILKKRGVSVYPCLIKSMQELTARGIGFADKLRRRGMPVIESYPGAAQDILGIPRKRASLDFLKEGMGEFGFRGDFLNDEVSHDELDSITSALVGLLFWGGRFEALGNDDEGYLIIPDLKADFRRWRGRRVIGLSGPIGAGKTTAGRFLESRGFHYGRFSIVLASVLAAQKVDPTRSALQRLGDELYQGGKQRWLGTELLKLLPDSGDLVVDGLRHPEDHALLTETFGPAFKHIHIQVASEVRLERIAPIVRQDELQSALGHRVESDVNTLSSLAHVRIVNDRELGEFLARIAVLADLDS